MIRSRKKKQNGKKRKVRINPQQASVSVPRGPQGFTVPGSAYGAVSGTKTYLPLQSGMGRKMVVANYEQIVVGSGLTGTGGFNIGGLVLNAGITANWPWLGSVATPYQKFCFKFLRFIYVPQTPTTTPGSAFLYAAYDPMDTAPATLAAVSASESSTIGNAWYGGPINTEIAFSKTLSIKDSIYLDFDLSKLTQPCYYTRATSGATSNTVTLTGTATGGNGTLAIASGGTYEYTARPGIIYFGTNNVTNGVVAGNLYMAYVVELLEPILAGNNA